jgi:hypothetical protein
MLRAFALALMIALTLSCSNATAGSSVMFVEWTYEDDLVVRVNEDGEPLSRIVPKGAALLLYASSGSQQVSSVSVFRLETCEHLITLRDLPKAQHIAIGRDFEGFSAEGSHRLFDPDSELLAAPTDACE